MTISINNKRPYNPEESQTITNKLSRFKLFLKREALQQEGKMTKRVKICRKRAYDHLNIGQVIRNKRPRFFAPRLIPCIAALKDITNQGSKRAPTRSESHSGSENNPNPAPKQAARRASSSSELQDLTDKIASLRINFR